MPSSIANRQDEVKMPAMSLTDPVQIEVWRNLFESIPDEMGAVLERTAYSPNIKERRDHSCAIFDGEGLLVAQAAHIPVHLGAMPFMMQKLCRLIEWHPGDMWICNDPEFGGTHLPDLTIVAPIFDPSNESTVVGFAANRAHHADIGGISAGSLPLSRELCQEGIILPPMRILTGGLAADEVINLICRNSRTPKERRGDLSAQIAANAIGVRRFCDLIKDHSSEELKSRIGDARLYTRQLIAEFLKKYDGYHSCATDYMESDGAGAVHMPITVAIHISSSGIQFDFSGSSRQSAGSVNATEAVTASAAYYVVRCLLQQNVPMNSAFSEFISIVAPIGTIVNPRPNAAVAAGNVETSQRIVDTILQALSGAFQDQLPACSQGTMNNVTLGGHDDSRMRSFAYYETIGGGCGATKHSPGASALHSHMTNTQNTPIEALEMHYPLRVRRYEIRRGSGGTGKNPGGDGIVRELEILNSAEVTILSERRAVGPHGSHNGSPGKPGRNYLIRNSETIVLDSKETHVLKSGDRLFIETPGGGGWGPSKE